MKKQFLRDTMGSHTRLKESKATCRVGTHWPSVCSETCWVLGPTPDDSELKFQNLKRTIDTGLFEPLDQTRALILTVFTQFLR